MSVNSEKIDASRPGKIHGEGPSTKAQVETGNFNEEKQKSLTTDDVRFTVKNSTFYAFVMGWPEKKAAIRRRGESSKPRCWAARANSSGSRAKRRYM